MTATECPTERNNAMTDSDNLSHVDRVEPRRQERIARDWQPNAGYETLLARVAAGEPDAVAAMTPRMEIEIGLYQHGKAAAAAHPTKEH